jgi:hypothetical protein
VKPSTQELAQWIAALPPDNPLRLAMQRLTEQMVDLLGDLLEDRIVVEGCEVEQPKALSDTLDGIA